MKESGDNSIFLQQIEEFDRDTVYWDDYYKANKATTNVSLFAQSIFEKYLAGKTGKVLELGCGNGRDSRFFLSKGYDVTAIDASRNAIAELQKEFVGEEKAAFFCGDFVNEKSIYIERYDFCYSRFSIHAIDEKQEDVLIKNVFSAMTAGGYFFIETRSVHDELYGKGRKAGEDAFFHDGHYRRFIRKEKLREKLEKNGFVIVKLDEDRGFAPYGEEDPIIIRCIAKKPEDSKRDEAGKLCRFTWNDGKIRTKWIYWADFISYDDFEAAALDCDYLQIWYPRRVDMKIGEKYKEILSIVEGCEFDFGDETLSKSIDLKMEEEQILAGFSKTRRYETRRAMERDGLEVSFCFPDEYDKDLNDYILFYNAFAEQKNLAPIQGEKLEKMLALISGHMYAVGRVYDQTGKLLVAHSYLVCEEMKTIALYESSSLELNPFIGRANGYLHYKAMCLFKSKGFKKYDVGGFYQGSDQQKMNISAFKDSLGGEIEKFVTGFSIRADQLRNVEKNLIAYRENIRNKKVIIYGMASWGKYVTRRIKELYGVNPECMIDNNLYKDDERYYREEVLKEYIPKDVVLIITTTYENFSMICAGKFVKPYFDEGTAYCIREIEM